MARCPETEQLLPSTNGYYDIPKNADGSFDIWFGPGKPKDVADAVPDFDIGSWVDQLERTDSSLDVVVK